MASDKKTVLFVCLGNICRSPIAEAVFIDTIKKQGVADKWEVDSAGIEAWHIGKPPDHRALAILAKHNLPYENIARQIKKDDFKHFDYIFAMDHENISDLEERAPSNSHSKLLLLGDFDPAGEQIIRDPYYDSGTEGFDKCYHQCERCCDAFLKKVQNHEI